MTPKEPADATTSIVPRQILRVRAQVANLPAAPIQWQYLCPELLSLRPNERVQVVHAAKRIETWSSLSLALAAIWLAWLVMAMFVLQDDPAGVAAILALSVAALFPTRGVFVRHAVKRLARQWHQAKQAQAGLI